MHEKPVFIFPLCDVSTGLSQVGGKAASLERMMVVGLPVPPGFTVTTDAYRRFIVERGLQAQILAAVALLRPDQPASVEDASRKIALLFEQSTMPEEIAGEIRRAYAGLGGGDVPVEQPAPPVAGELPSSSLKQPAEQVAVRSSATAEDLLGMSFAGQQETYLTSDVKCT